LVAEQVEEDRRKREAALPPIEYHCTWPPEA
jgi:hypothetical protein